MKTAKQKKSRFILNAFALLCFTSFMVCVCSCDDKDSIAHSTNDTSFILRMVIDSAFADDNMHDIDRLTKIHDSIIFLYDKNYTKFLPIKVKGSILKFLTKKEIYSLAIRHYNSAADPLFFLALTDFQKHDSVYKATLHNYCVLPLFNSNGELRKLGKVYVQGTMLNFDENQTITNKDSCIVGFRCGGGMSMTFLKKGDSLKAKVDGRWSN